MKNKKLFIAVFSIIGLITNSIGQSLPSYVPTNGLLGWFSFTGNARDTSGNNNHGTVKGATLTSDRFEKKNCAYIFNGTTNYIETPILQKNVTEFSISMWFRTTNGGWMFEGSRDCNGGVGTRLSLIPSANEFVYGASDVGYSDGSQTTSLYNDSNWHHVVGVWNGTGNSKIDTNQFSVYIDGYYVSQKGATSVGTGGTGGHRSIPISGTATCIIGGVGCGAPGWIHNFDGLLDDIGIWKRALNDSEIIALFKGNYCNPPKAPQNTSDKINLTICLGDSAKLSARGIGQLAWYSASSGGIHLGKDSNYTTTKLSKTTTFYVQDSTCEASTTRTAITVIVKSQAKSNFSVNDICENDSAIFVNQSQNAETYIWKFGDGQKSNMKSPKHRFNIGGISQTFNVNLVALVSNGCSDSITKFVTVNANPKSDYSYTSSGKKYDFSASQSGNSNYRWLFGDGDSANNLNVSHTYKDNLSSHNVCLRIINTAGCVSETCKEIGSTEISFSAKQPDFKIYPNPNSGSFNIEMIANKKDLTIEIFNQVGQMVHKTELKKEEYTMDLKLANGVYIIKITDEKYCTNQKILIRK